MLFKPKCALRAHAPFYTFFRRGLACLAAVSASVSVAAAEPLDVSALSIGEPVAAARGPARQGTLQTEYVVTLSSPSVAKYYKNAGKPGKEAQKAHARGLDSDQDKAANRVRQLGGRELARVNKALNALVVSLDARQVRELELTDGVVSVRPLNRYELDLSQTVRYIGAAALHSGGNNGAGVRVAVLDSGIDYTHAAFGGAGTAAAYAAAYGATTADAKNKTTDGLFPTAKVVGGYDFVGEVWPGTAANPQPLQPDPDPIDCGRAAVGAPCVGGHGTHVADIIGGNTGVAPGVSFYAVKVCSAVATSCSGIALLQGVDFALDPNADGDVSDRVDIINLSLGSPYGQIEDDLTAALDDAAGLGVVVVASAGNSADRPYIVGSPSIGRSVISVAQTHVPTARSIPLVVNSPAAIAGTYRNTATVDWAPVGSGVTGDVAYIGRGCPAGSIDPGTNPDDPYLASPAGKIALIDRGACSVSLKVDRAVAAGATGVLIGLVAAGDAITFGYGGGTRFAPTLVIQRTLSLSIQANLAGPVNVTISEANAISLKGSMASTSSRGPSMSSNSIKPDIGAPGASVSAEAGTGTLATPFGGTSGAAPMVSGAAALMLQARPGLSPAEIRSLLMNTAETQIFTNPVLLPGALAPITRIGGGEVRVDKAVESKTAAWDKDDLAGSLSFGYTPASKRTKLTRTVVVHNYGGSDRTYLITPAFRYADDAASGAVSIKALASIKVGGGNSKQFDVEITIDPDRLNVWTLNGGSRGGDGFRLQGVELDGYVKIDGGPGNAVTLAWQVLPHRAADVSADPKKVNLKNDGTGSLKLKNQSAVLAGRVDVFSLTGQSDQIKKKLLPQPGDNFAIVDLKAVGVRLVSLGGVPHVQFAIDTYGARAHPNYPAEFDIYIDANRDGVPDAVIFNLENGAFASSGQNVVASGPLAGPIRVRFFADADLNSGNIIMTAPLSALGLTPGTTFDFSVYAFDNYFTGNQTDAIEGMTYTLDTPRFVPSSFAPVVPASGSVTLGIAGIAAGDTKSPSQSGLLLMYRDAEGKARKDVGKDEAQAIEVKR